MKLMHDASSTEVHGDNSVVVQPGGDGPAAAFIYDARIDIIEVCDNRGPRIDHKLGLD